MSIPTSGPFADQNLTALFPKLMKFTPQQLSQVQGLPGWFMASVLGAQADARAQGAQLTPPTQTVVQRVIDQAVGAPPAGAEMPAPQAPTQMASHGGYIHDYGVASLPYEANYGHGGIVSFYGGGDTDLDKELQKYTPEEMANIRSGLDAYALNKRRTPEEMANIRSGLADYALNKRRTPEEMANIRSGLADYANKKKSAHSGAPIKVSAIPSYSYGMDMSTADAAAKFSKFAQENPAQAKAIGVAVGAVGVAGVTAALTVAGPAALALGLEGCEALAPHIAKLGYKGVMTVLAGGGGGYLGYSAADTAATPLPPEVPGVPHHPHNTQKPAWDVTNSGTGWMGAGDPNSATPGISVFKDPSMDDSADASATGAAQNFGLPPINSEIPPYPDFVPQELPPKYDEIEEAKKQAAANERFHVDPDYAKNELAKNDAKLAQNEEERKGVYSGEALSRFGMALANNNSGQGLLTGIAQAAPNYAAATGEGNEYARTRADLLDTHGELLRGQEQERNVNRADAAFADQNKREAEIRVAKNADINAKLQYGINKSTTQAEQRDRITSQMTEMAKLIESARQSNQSLLELQREHDLTAQSTLQTLIAKGADLDKVEAGKQAVSDSKNLTSVVTKLNTDFTTLLKSGTAGVIEADRENFVSRGLARYKAALGSQLSVDNQGAPGIAGLPVSSAYANMTSAANSVGRP